MKGLKDFDFVNQLGSDISVEILMHLDDPSDLARVCSVSSSWNKFVIAYGLFRHMCLKIYPEMSSFAHAIDVNNMIEPLENSPTDSNDEPNTLEKNHKVYALLANGLNPIIRTDCISMAISASSTDNYPTEKIDNTLRPGDKVEQKASYWSSKGTSDPKTPEALIYRLMSDLCIVTEIHIQPFQAFFHYGYPIYSARAVRFRMGHPMYPLEIESDLMNENAAGHKFFENSFIWTYTSPDFPMAQENCIQKFKLPEPAICMGGILEVELLGRVQTQETDDLYYICIAHVKALGRPLLNCDLKMVDQTGKSMIRYNPASSRGESKGASRLRTFTTDLMSLDWEEIILTTLRRNVGGLVVLMDNSDE